VPNFCAGANGNPVYSLESEWVWQLLLEIETHATRRLEKSNFGNSLNCITNAMKTRFLLDAIEHDDRSNQ
jgi:hypothetical protein